MTLKLPGLAGIAACLLGSVAPAAEPVPQVGDVAPDFTSKSLLTHEKVQLSAQRGRLVFLSFFASWCAPCRKEVPILEAVQRRLRERARVLAVNFHENDEAAVRHWAHDNKLEMVIVEDYGGHIAQRYGVTAIPHLLIIGPDGRILQVHQGYSTDSLDDLVADINEVLRSTAAAAAAPDAASATQSPAQP